MGEYILVDGETVKLGTLESLYYTTYQQLKAALEAGRCRHAPGNLPPWEYLKPGYFRYRFPFPDETGVRIGHHQPYDRGVTFPAPAELVASIQHNDVYESVSDQAGMHSVNVWFDCPLDPGADPTKHSPAYPIVELIQQKPVEGELWAVVRCPYCHAAVRMDRGDVLRLRAAVREAYPDPDKRANLEQLLAIALEGYKPGAGEDEP